MHILKKYWLGIALTFLFIYIGWSTYGNFDDGMFLASCLGIMAYIIGIIISGTSGSGRMAITMINGLVSIFKFIWYVVSLKPLRRLVSRMRITGGSPQPYPYLALYGSITDCQAMMDNYSSSFWRDRTPAVRAALWRLFSRDVLTFAPGANGYPVIRLGAWRNAPSDGVDQALEQTLYLFLRQCAMAGGEIDIKGLYKVINYQPTRHQRHIYDTNNQFRFADLLSTPISKKDYNDVETRNIYGMKRFLKSLPYSFSQLTGNASQIDLQRIWSEYVAYAFLFGIDKKVMASLYGMFPAGAQPPLLHLLNTSAIHRKLLYQLMNSASAATYNADDIVSANRGRLKAAWHAEEVYDIKTS